MKKYYSKIETKGLPGGPNEQFTYITGVFSSDVFSTEGYKRNSPDKNNPYNIIPSGNITMEGVDFPVMGMDNLGNTKAMMPGNDYKFPGDTVFETPMYKRGGGLLTKTMKCNSCGWSWKAADGGNDVTTCHKCGGEALPKAQGGGSKNKEPIIVPPGDPRAQAYADSLTLYNKGRKDAELIKPLLKDKGYLTWDEYFKTSSNPVNYATNPNIVVSDFGDAWLRIMELNQENPDFGRGTRKIQFPVGDDIASTNIFDYHLYAKPVQPVIVDPDMNEWKPKRTTPDPNRSVADNLKLMGEDTSFTNRKKLFLDAGLGDTYTGTAEQNVLLNKWLHDGRSTNTTEETVQDNPYKGSTNDITSTNTNNEQTTQESIVDRPSDDIYVEELKKPVETIKQKPGAWYRDEAGNLKQWWPNKQQGGGVLTYKDSADSHPAGGYQKRIKRKIPIEGSAPQYQTGGGTVKGRAATSTSPNQKKQLTTTPKSEKPLTTNEDQILTYKDNADWFDSRAVYSDDPKYDDSIRRGVYSGKYGYNPATQMLYPLKKEDQVEISDETKNILDLQQEKIDERDRVRAMSPEAQEAYRQRKIAASLKAEGRQPITIDEIGGGSNPLLREEDKTGRRPWEGRAGQTLFLTPEEIEAYNKDWVAKSMVAVGENPLFYAPGIIAGGAALPALGEAVAASSLGSYLGAPMTVAGTTIPGATAGNLINAGFAGHGLYNVIPDAIDFATNPSWEGVGDLTMDVLEIAPIAGAARQSMGELVKSYNKVATGNSMLPVAWKMENVSAALKPVKNKFNLTDEEAFILGKYLDSPYNIERGSRESEIFDQMIKRNPAILDESNSVITKVINHSTATDKDFIPTKWGSQFTFPGNRSWTLGVDPRFANMNRTRLVIPSKYNKDIDFMAVDYGNPKLYEGINASDYKHLNRYKELLNNTTNPSEITRLNNEIKKIEESIEEGIKIKSFANENELIGNIPEGYKVIGRSTEGGFDNIFIKPIRGYKPVDVSKQLPGSPNAPTSSFTNYLTTQTPLKNAWQYNPWRFKANPEAYYHRSPNIENIINQEKRILQGFGESEAGKAYTKAANAPVTGFNLKKGANNQLYFSKGVPLDYGRYNSRRLKMTGQGYKGPYIVEVEGVPMGSSVKGRPPKSTPPTTLEGYAVSRRPISLDEAKFYKEHWWRGYEPIEVPKQLPGSPNTPTSWFNTRAQNALLVEQARRSGEAPLPDYMVPYISRRYTPATKQQEIFESFLSPETQAKLRELRTQRFTREGPASNEYQQGGEIIPEDVKNMKAALDKELKAVKNYNLTPAKKNKLIQELYTIYNESVPPKFQLGGPVLSAELQMYKDYITGKDESPEAVKNYDKLNRIHYKKAKANNTSPANYIMTELIS